MTDYLGCCFYKLAATPGRSGVDNSWYPETPRVVLLTLKATVTHHNCPSNIVTLSKLHYSTSLLEKHPRSVQNI